MYGSVQHVGETLFGIYPTTQCSFNGIHITRPQEVIIHVYTQFLIQPKLHVLFTKYSSFRNLILIVNKSNLKITMISWVAFRKFE